MAAMVFPSMAQPAAFRPPRLMERDGSGKIRSGSIFMNTPRPAHLGQAPNGLLNENMRGVSSSMLMPCSGQA